jgi:hypothetical protein
MKMKWALVGGTALGMLLGAQAQAQSIVIFATVQKQDESGAVEFAKTVDPDTGQIVEVNQLPVTLEQPAVEDALTATAAIAATKDFGTVFGGISGEFEDGSEFFYNFDNTFDPVSNTSFGATDFGAPSAFGFSAFGFAIAPPIPGLAAARTSYVPTCSGGDGAGAPGTTRCTYFLAPGSTHIAEYDINGFAGDGGASIVPALSLDALGPMGKTIAIPGPGLPTPGTPVVSPITIIDCTTVFGGPGCFTMSHAIAFAGSGGGDSWTFNSGFVINPVPVPAGLALLGLGLLGLGVAAGRRRAL